MNDSFSQFFQALRNTDVGTKLVVAVTAVALIGAIAIVGLVSKDPHFEVAFTGLTDAELVGVSKALADGGLEFRAVKGDGSNAITTRGDDVLQAQQLAYAADAISHVTKGILGGGSDVSIFAGQLEREQMVREKEMSEIEKVVEVLDYITQAEIFLPKEATSSLRGPVKESVSMVVKTKNGLALSSSESQTLAMTLSGALDIGLDKIMITDQKGRMVHGGGGADDQGLIDGRFLELQREFNRREAERVNAALADVLGPNKARVTVSSEFDFVQSTVQTTSSGKEVALSSRTFETSSPVGTSAAGGGIAGATGNVPINAGKPGQADVSGLPTGQEQMSTSEEKETQYFVPTTDTFEIHNQPKLKRLSVSLALDESLAARQADIEANVKSMVGFDESRKDSFNALVHPFVVPEVPEGTAVGEDGEPLPEALPEQSAFSVDTLLGHGVELISALAFVFLLLKGLKGAKASAKSSEGEGGTTTITASGGPGQPAVEINPEDLARAQVEDLVQNNPERVAQILSNWVVEDRSPVKQS